MLMTFFACLFIIALLGLIIGLLSSISAVKQIIATGRGATRLIERPKRSALRIVETGKAAALNICDHGFAIGTQVKKSADSVGKVKRDFETVSRSAELGAILNLFAGFNKSR